MGRHEKKERDSSCNNTLAIQTREFLDSSTLHGVRYLTAEKGRHPCERAMWLVFLGLGLGASGLIIASLWEKFQTSPTITGLDADFHDWDVTFPAVTLCPMNSVSEELLNLFVNESLSSDEASDAAWIANSIEQLANVSYSNLRYINNISSLPGRRIELRTLIRKVTYQCTDIFEECTWKLKTIDCCQYFYPVFTENGFCFAFNSLAAKISKQSKKNVSEIEPEYIYETDPAWAIDVKSSCVFENNIKVYIHAWNEDITRENRPQLVWNGESKRLSFSVKHTYTTQDARQLSIQQRKCVFEDEIALVTSPRYSYSACMQQYRVMRAHKLCDCVPHISPYAENYRYCRAEEFKCLSNFAAELNDIRECDCELGCDHMIYEVEKLTEITTTPTGILEVGFVSWPMIRYKREVLFGWVDLLVSFGGIAGLFLGFSLLSGIEILYYFSMRAACYAINGNQKSSEPKKTKKKNKVHPSKDEIFTLGQNLTKTYQQKLMNTTFVVKNKKNPHIPRPFLN